jgi:hypothetical protein
MLKPRRKNYNSTAFTKDWNILSAAAVVTKLEVSSLILVRIGKLNDYTNLTHIRA